MAVPAPRGGAGTGAAPVLELRDITMRFGLFHALDGVGLDVYPGEIVALLGENGCGKSTLVKVLAGVNVPEPGGTLRLSGADVPLPLAPGQFRELGLSFVHQDLGLARTLSVVENLMVGDAATRRGMISWRKETRRVRTLLREYGVDVDPLLTINELPPVGQALVAIVRAAEEQRRFREEGTVGQSILFLDEPTVFLPENEVEFLFDLVRTIVRDGASVVFISHDLDAVRRLCDRAVVLHDGVVAGEARLDEVTDEQLIEMIVGQSAGLVGATYRRQETDDEPPAAELPVVAGVSGLSGGRVERADLTVHAGEIVGIAGLLGSGAEEVPYLCFGAHRSTGGTLTIDGRPLRLTRLTAAEAVQHRIALVPADRRRDGIAASMTVGENATILVNDRYTRLGGIRFKRVRSRVGELLEKFDVRPRNASALLGRLSGGNQQKVVLAKWMEIEPRLLLLHEPTQGVDVAARASIYRHVRQATATGMGTLWVSNDFEELATVCDRVLVMADGVIRAELTGEDVTEDRISTSVYQYSTNAASVLADVPGA
ncbi:sugar ABC transporter ATP-binding protein [Nocardioides sp. KR10-350]|uniref:sugar ABC transporter ATP-binding protein n=1 Tax=Nocardioides cheoyonin TaxID=3156615 RepID=UPI0032B437B4